VGQDKGAVNPRIEQNQFLFRREGSCFQIISTKSVEGDGIMSSGESTYLIFVVVAFVVFCLGLLWGVSATKHGPSDSSKH